MTANEFKKRAQEAELAAKRATSTAEREAYERVAQGWRQLAAQAERGAKRES